MNGKTALLATLTATLFVTGCISTHETVVNDVSRTPVEFENDAAARSFYESLSRIPNSGQQQESKTEVSLPIVFEHEKRVVRGPNHAFNAVVARCDTNRDGKITESEARIFSEQVK